ncbi:hypothetical protein LCGC14_2082940 [marine sediment metagenome]|uniref:Uncharacterized protein n=1 Tax=marine sediment metagenome TaxID=412755 RepID=A0A0F9EEW5_9ZZZZ
MKRISPEIITEALNRAYPSGTGTYQVNIADIAIAQAQLDDDKKELKVIFEKIESSELAPDTDDDQTVRIIILSYGKFQALKKRVLK